MHSDAMMDVGDDGSLPLKRASHGGEDYELLITSPNALPLPHAMHVGTIVAEKGMWLKPRRGKREPLESRGFEHSL